MNLSRGISPRSRECLSSCLVVNGTIFSTGIESKRSIRQITKEDRERESEMWLVVRGGNRACTSPSSRGLEAYAGDPWTVSSHPRDFLTHRNENPGGLMPGLPQSNLEYTGKKLSRPPSCEAHRTWPPRGLFFPRGGTVLS